MSLFRKAVVSALSAIVISGGRFVLIVILARRLPSIEFGQFVYAQWLVDLMFMISALGVNAMASRYLAEYAHDPERRAAFLRRWFPLAFGLPALSGILAVGGAMVSDLMLTPLSYAFMASWAIATGWWTMQTAALYGHQRFDLVLRANLMFVAMVIPGALLLPTEIAFPESLFALLTLSSLCACGFGYRQIAFLLEGARVTKRVELPWLKIRSYALNLWLTALLWSLVWSRGELPLVRVHLGDEGVARYTVALTVFFGGVQGIMLWVGGVAPHLTSEWARGHKTQAIATARRLADVQLLVSTCAALILACFGPELLQLFFGTTYRTSAPILAILALGLITLSASVQNHLLQLETDARFNRNSSLMGLILLYAVASIAIPWLGTVGAAIARTLTMWGLFLMSMVFVWRYWGKTALSGRNTLIAIFAVSGPTLLLISGQNHYVLRALVGGACLLVLLLMMRGVDGQLVAKEIATNSWPRICRFVNGWRAPRR